MRKYGVRFNTIRYWQNQARMLWRYRGMNAFVSERIYYDYHYQNMPARAIAAFAIKMAELDIAIESL